MEFELAQIESYVVMFMLPLFRITAFFMVVPIIGTRMVPQRIRMGLALLLTMIVAPLLPDTGLSSGLNLATALAVCHEMIIGIMLAFFLQVFFHLFMITGQMIAMQMGLGFASMVDPTNGVSVAVVSQLFVIMTTLLFLLMNGHLVMIEIMIDSFKQFPAGEMRLPLGSLVAITHSATWMFSNALILALPIVCALLIVNIAFGIMTRAAPQLNVFALGFPSAIVLGGIFIWYATAGFDITFKHMLDSMFIDMAALGN